MLPDYKQAYEEFRTWRKGEPISPEVKWVLRAYKGYRPTGRRVTSEEMWVMLWAGMLYYTELSEPQEV